jgi:hypothetical protein
MTIRIKQQGTTFVYETGPLPGTPVATGGPEGAVQFNNGGLFGGSSNFVFNNLSSTLTVTNLSGSLTHLADGTSYIRAGSNITIATSSNGSITISSAGGTLSGGGNQWNELSPSPKLNTTASIAIAGDLGKLFSAQSAGSDVFFFVSGSVTGSSLNSRVSLFGGDVVVSGSISGKNGFDFSGNFMEISGSLSVSGSLQATGSIGIKGNIIPDRDVTYTLGTSAKRWGHIYTGDLHLRNDRGDWTIVEERDFLCVVNNITGKKYKMMLQPLDD